MGGKSYSDLDDVFPEDIFNYVDEFKQVPTTAARSPEQYEEFFASFLNDYDCLIHLACSSGISSIFNYATMASNKFDGKVVVIDTKTLSNGIAIIANRAHDYIKNGIPFLEIVEKIKELIPRVQASFLLDKLTNLYYGGRCKGLVYHIANVLNLKIVINMERDGKMAPRDKYRGSIYRTVKRYIKETFEKRPNPNLNQIYIAYTTKNDEMIEIIKEEIAKYHNFENIDVNYVGCNCAVHSGRNTYGIFYETIN